MSAATFALVVTAAVVYALMAVLVAGLALQILGSEDDEDWIDRTFGRVIAGLSGAAWIVFLAIGIAALPLIGFALFAKAVMGRLKR